MEEPKEGAAAGDVVQRLLQDVSGLSTFALEALSQGDREALATEPSLTALAHRWATSAADPVICEHLARILCEISGAAPTSVVGHLREAVPALAEAVRQHTPTESVAIQCCRLGAAVCTSDELRAMFPPDALTSVLGLLEGNKAPEVAPAALGFLNGLCKGSAGAMETLRASNGVVTVLDVLEANLTQETAEVGVKTMAVLSADPANMALLGNEGGVDIVMNFLRQYPGLPAVAADSLGCLASLSQAEEIRQILEEDGGMETVVEHTFAPLGGSGGADPLPQALLNGLRALLNFCVSEALRVSACRAGLVTGLVSTLNLISSLEARQAALNIMLILSSPTQDVEASMEIQEFLVSNGAARALAPLLGEPTVGSQEATIAGTVLLRILSFNEVIYPELAESASAIMSALERHSGNQDLAVVCLELLSALSSQEKLHPAVLGESSASSEALIRALLSTLRIHGEAPELVLRVLFALGNFTVQLVVQHGLVSGGGVPILLNILNSAVLPAVAQGCCKVLENLCSLDREHLVPKLREQGCGKGLVTALAKHSGSGQTDVLQAVLRVLQSLAGSADDNSPQAIQGHQELIAAGILPGLLPLLNMEVAVAAQVLYLLLTLSVDISEEIRSSVCTPGGFEALARAVVEKAHSGELLQCAMPLLVRLAGGAATTLAHVATTLPSFLTSVVGMLASPTEGKGSAVVPIASAQLCAILSSTDPKVAEHLSVLDALQHLSKLASSASESPEATEHVVSSAHAVASILVHGGEPALTAAQSLAPSLRALVAKAVENPMPEPHAQLCQAALQRLTAATEPASTSSPAEDSPAPAEHSATAEVPPPPAPSESADQQQQQQQQQQPAPPLEEEGKQPPPLEPAAGAASAPEVQQDAVAVGTVEGKPLAAPVEAGDQDDVEGKASKATPVKPSHDEPKVERRALDASDSLRREDSDAAEPVAGERMDPEDRLRQQLAAVQAELSSLKAELSAQKQRSEEVLAQAEQRATAAEQERQKAQAELLEATAQLKQAKESNQALDQQLREAQDAVAQAAESEREAPPAPAPAPAPQPQPQQQAQSPVVRCSVKVTGGSTSEARKRAEVAATQQLDETRRKLLRAENQLRSVTEAYLRLQQDVDQMNTVAQRSSQDLWEMSRKVLEVDQARQEANSLRLKVCELQEQLRITSCCCCCKCCCKTTGDAEHSDRIPSAKLLALFEAVLEQIRTLIRKTEDAMGYPHFVASALTSACTSGAGFETLDSLQGKSTELLARLSVLLSQATCVDRVVCNGSTHHTLKEVMLQQSRGQTRARQ
eukprot:RCo015853